MDKEQRKRLKKKWIQLLLTLTFCYGALLFSPKPAKRTDDLEIEKISAIQQQLKNTVNDFKHLDSFLDEQKLKINEGNQTIKNLSEQQQSLEPLVKADRKLLDAVFEEQRVRSRNAQWIDRGYGVAIGVVGSLIASAIFHLIVTKNKEVAGLPP